MHYQFFSVLWKQEGKISPHSTASGLRKVILSEQVEVWLILSESQLALVCLLKFVVTCVPTRTTQKNKHSNKERNINVTNSENSEKSIN
jgi:hypothetical protein